MKKRGQNEGTIFEERPGRWIAVMTVGYEVKDGRRRRIRRKFVAETRQGVSEKLNEALAKHQRGGIVTTNQDTLGKFMTDWLAHTVKPSVRPKTYRSYEQMLRNHLVKNIPIAEWEKRELDNVPGLAPIQLRKLDVAHVERYMNAKLAAGNSPALVRYLRTVLRIALNEAIRRELIDRNAAAMVRPPSGRKAPIEPLTGDQAQKLYNAVQGHRLEALFTVALAVGLRHGEALALQWTDGVDFEKAELRVFHTLQRIDGQLTRTAPKSEESRRVVPLDETCMHTLRRHRERQDFERQLAGDRWKETGYVFTSSIGTPLNDRNVLRDFHKLLAAAGLPRRRFHDLRHACVSLLAAQGVPDKTIAEIVGHSDVRLTKNVYQHAQKEQKRDAISKVGNFLQNPVAPLVAPQTGTGKIN